MINTINKRDGRYVIKAREKQNQENIIEGRQNPHGWVIENGLIHMTPTPLYQRRKALDQLEKLGVDTSVLNQVKTQTPPASEELSFKKAKKHKKKKRKGKKGAKKMAKHVSEHLSERNERSGNLMAELMKKADEIMIVDNVLWVYNVNKGCYENCNINNISSKLRLLLDKKERLKVSSQEYKEAYNQLMISEELVSDKGFFANGPYVNCANGVVDVLKGKLLPHSYTYRFKHCLNVDYNPNAKCKKFLEFVDLITGEDKQLKHLLMCMLGYLLSHYNYAKMAFLLYGPSNVGKSVFCKLLTGIIGEAYISRCDLTALQKQEFAATLGGTLLNVAPDIKNGVLKDVGAFKALTSHNDTIAARALYENPCKVTGETKMLFSSNHLIGFDSALDIGDIEAVFNRLLYFPFMNQPITEDEDKKDFAQELLDEEKEGIFLFAMEGLKMYLENDNKFPKAKESEKLKFKNMAQYCPEKTFFDKCLVIDEGSCESTEVVRKAYEDFCKSNEITEMGNLKTYIVEQKKIVVKKKRIDDNGVLLSAGNPRASYIGVKLKEKYRK